MMQVFICKKNLKKMKLTVDFCLTLWDKEYKEMKGIKNYGYVFK